MLFSKLCLKCFYLSFAIFHIFLCANAQQKDNKPERVAWFQDLAFGMFIHWNVDVSLGGVISHSLAGASDDYVNRYIEELPLFFNPNQFDPNEWATMAKLAGMKYVVFTAKHHAGFCMFDTKTTPFNVMNTPYKSDITKQLIDAFRRQGIAIGIYFSPEDFYFLHQQKLPLGRLQHPMHYPVNNKALFDYDRAQLKELLTHYGNIDILFIDGPGDGLREYAWSINPDLVITRDLMKTPEQNIPDAPLPRPWEACYTMGTDWQYKATNDPHKSGTEIINMLIEIRAKGGNFLLNVGPKPDGSMQAEQENLLREIALWNFANRESIYEVKPLPTIRDGDLWFTQANNDETIYAFVTREEPSDWAYGTRRNFLLPHITGSERTKVSILGYKSELVEYQKGLSAEIIVSPSPVGLAVSAVNGQRFYTNNQWPNPIVLKIEHAQFKTPAARNVEKSVIDGAK
ncbi:alpha-L-fucosidase [Olivibacter jilunii]